MMYPWQAVRHPSNALAPMESRIYSFSVKTNADVEGPLDIDIRLRFRSLPPYLLRSLGMEEEAEKLEIVDIDHEDIRVEVIKPSR